jgi:hypothetical protein
VPGNQQSFVFVVPISDAAAARLTTLRLSGGGREAVRTALRSPNAQLPHGIKLATEARRVAGGGIGIRWDPRTHPMVMIRDTETGEVLSLARGGTVQLSSFKREVDLVLSDGVKSRVQRLRVNP